MDEFSQAVQAYRQTHFYQTDERLVHTIEEALQFINDVGFCLFYRHDSLELPNLRDATAGDPGTREGLNWEWKDRLASEQVVYYGRPFRRKPGFVALPLLVPLYALSAAADVGGDHDELALTGTLSAEAHRIADTVIKRGSLSTRMLRQECGLAASKDKARFGRGLEDAQEKFLVTMVRTTSSSRAGYSYIWDSFTRVWPSAVEEAERMNLTTATASIVAAYLKIAGAATAKQIAYTFSLEPELVQKAANSLLTQEAIGQITRGGAVYFASQDFPGV